MSLFGDLGGSESVFDDARVPIPNTDFDKGSRLAFEKEMLGLYLSDHPLMGVEAALARHCDATIAELREKAARETEGDVDGAAAAAGGWGGGKGGDVKTVGGVITNLVRKYTKRGDLMATFTLEDLESTLDVWVFPRTMMEVGYLLTDDAVVCVKGRLDTREEAPKFICMEVKRPELVVGAGTEPVHIWLPLHALTDARVDLLGGLSGEPVLLEVEVVDPMLSLDTHPEAARRLAQAVLAGV